GRFPSRVIRQIIFAIKNFIGLCPVSFCGRQCFHCRLELCFGMQLFMEWGRGRAHTPTFGALPRRFAESSYASSICSCASYTFQYRMSVAGTKRCSDSVPLIHSYNCTRYSPGDASPRNCPCHSIVSRSLLTLWKYFPVKVPPASLFILSTF